MPTGPFLLPTREAVEAYGLSRYAGTEVLSDNNPFLNTKPTLLPNKPEASSNEVVLDFFPFQYPKVEQVAGPGGVNTVKFTYDGATPDNTITYRIKLADDAVIRSVHSHNWEEMDVDAVSGFVKKVMDGTTKVGEVWQDVKNAISNTTGDGAGTGASPRVQIDRQKIYKPGAQFPSVTIEFILFTKNNFYRDIFIPLMSLTALSYPSRKGFSDSEIKEIIGGISVAVPSTAAGAINNINQVIIKATEKWLVGTRAYVYDNPHLCNVRHLSGLYSHSNCHITNIDYQYGKSWYNGYFDPFNREFNQSQCSYPTLATVSITLESGERAFSDTWLSQIPNGFRQYIDDFGKHL